MDKDKVYISGPLNTGRVLARDMSRTSLNSSASSASIVHQTHLSAELTGHLQVKNESKAGYLNMDANAHSA